MSGAHPLAAPATHRTRRLFHTPSARRATILAGAALLGVLTPAAPAQPAPQPAKTPTPPAAEPGELTAPIDFPSLGMSIRLPAGAVMETTLLGEVGLAARIIPTDRTWRLMLSERRIEDHAAGPAAVIDRILADYASLRRWGRPGEQQDAGSQTTIIERDDALILSGLPAARVYALVPAADQSPVVFGHTVVRAEPGRYVEFTVECLQPELERVRSIVERSIETASFPRPEDVAADRAAAVLAGDSLLQTLSYDELLATIPAEPIWLRLYRPGESGLEQDAQEVAYQRLEIRRGSRGEVSGRPESQWQGVDHDEGLVVRQSARFLDEARVVDSFGVYFYREDFDGQDEESWSVRMRVSEGGREAVWTETGVRAGGRLTVRVQPEGAAPTERTWMTPDRAYLSQTHTYLLPRILAQTESPIVCAFYAYSSTSGRIELRRDVLAPRDSGGWTLRTRLGEGVGERISTLDDDGALVRLETADGIIVEPTDTARIQQIWRAKGLPTGN